MSPSEWTIVITGIVGVVSSVAGGGITYGVFSTRLRHHSEKLVEHTERMDGIEQDLIDHEKNERPHQACVVHSTELASMAKSLDKLSTYHDNLAERVVDLMVNGKKKKENADAR